MSSIIDRTPELLEIQPFAQEYRDNPRSFDAVLLGSSPGFINPEGIPSACVSTYEHTMTVLKNVDQFSSVKPEGLPGMERVDFFNGQPVMNYSDPPQHTRLRRIVNPTFSPRRIQEMTEATTRNIEGLLARIPEGEVFDAVDMLTKPMSVRLLLQDFLGVEEKDQHIFLEYLSSLYLLDKMRPGDPKPKAFLDAWEKGREYCREALARARAEKSENLISIIANAQEGGAMSDTEMMAMMVVLFSGGISTLAGTATSALYHLAKNPDIADRVRQDPALAKRLTEECLRFDPPVTLVMRFATGDIELGGKNLRKGMPVYTMISVANRDPAVFPDPDRFSIDRENLRHVTFGYGIHACIGNSFTRATVPLMAQMVVQRFPSLRLGSTEPLTWSTTPRSRHMASVPLMA